MSITTWGLWRRGAAPDAGAANAVGANSAIEANPAVRAPPLSNAYTRPPTKNTHSATVARKYATENLTSTLFISADSPTSGNSQNTQEVEVVAATCEDDRRGDRLRRHVPGDGRRRRRPDAAVAVAGRRPRRLRRLGARMGGGVAHRRLERLTGDRRPRVGVVRTRRHRLSGVAGGPGCGPGRATS